MEGIAMNRACCLPPPTEGISVVFSDPKLIAHVEMGQIPHPPLCDCEREEYDILARMSVTYRLITVLFAMSCAFGQFLRGVNLAGAEFGENSIPGTFNT